MSVIVRVYADQVERDQRTLTSGVVGHSYSDVTTSEYSAISNTVSYPTQEWNVLRFRLPGDSSLASATIHSVKIYPYFRTGMGTSSFLLAGLSNTAQSDATHQTLGQSITSGRKEYDVTEKFEEQSINAASDWYVRLLLSAVSADSMTAYCNGAAESFRFYVELDVTGIPSACTAPTSVSVDNATPAPSADVTLSFSGAGPGNWNTITGYDIYRSSGGSYSLLKSITTTETYGSTTVTSPAAPGDSYYYKIVTKGSEGEAYYSGLSAQYVTVTATTSACVAPSVISLSASTSARPVFMNWGGAYGGLGNPITAYQLQYSESADNSTWGAWTDINTLSTTDTSGSYLVPIAATLGHYRRYQIKTIGTLDGYDSEWSAASASVRTKSSSVAAIPTPKLIAYEYPHVVAGVEKGPYPLGMIGKFETLIWRRKYQGVGECSISLPFSTEAIALLDCGNLIGIAGRNELMVITTISVGKNEKGVETITVRGKSLPMMLSMRAVTQSAQSEDHPVGQIKSLLRNQPIFLEHYDEGTSAWVDDINGDLDANGDRRFPDFHWKEPSFTYATDTPIAYQPEKLAGMLDSVIALCKIEGYGLRITASYFETTSDTYTLYFEIYKGIDRSESQFVNPHVIFDEKLGNLRTQGYTRSIENVKTAGYATNSIIDALSTSELRLVDLMSENAYTAGDQTYINAGSNPANVNGGSGMSRSELGMTVSEITEPASGTDGEKVQVLYDSCKRLGRAEIAKAAEEQAFEITINPYVGQQYMIDYDLGDIVTAKNARWGVSMDARIAETEEVYEPGKKMQVSLTLGEPSITLLGRMKQISRRRG